MRMRFVQPPQRAKMASCRYWQDRLFGEPGAYVIIHCMPCPSGHHIVGRQPKFRLTPFFVNRARFG